MIDIGTLKGSIAIDGVDNAKKGLDDVGGSTSALDERFNTIIGTAKKVVTALAIGAVIKKSIDVATQAVNDFADTGDRIDKLSQKMSLSAKEFQKWESIAGHNGSSIESYGNIMKKLADTTEKNAEAFSSLGVVVQEQDGTLRSQSDIFQDTVIALSEMEDGTERNRLAQELFGKGYTELLPLINGGKDAILEQIAAAEDAVVMTDEQVKSAAAYKDAQQAMEEQIKKVQMALVENLVPVLTSLMNWMSENIPKIKEVCQPVFDFIGEVIGVTIELVSQLINWIKDFFTTNEEVQEGIGTVWENIQEIFYLAWDTIKAGVDAFVKVFNDIWEEYGEEITVYIETVWNSIQIYFGTVFNVIKDLLNIFKAIFEGDWSALWENVKKLVVDIWEGIKSFIVNILTGIVDILKSIVPKFMQAGKDMFNAIWNGMKEIWNNLKRWVDEKVNWLKDKIMFWKKGSAEIQEEQNKLIESETKVTSSTKESYEELKIAQSQMVGGVITSTIAMKKVNEQLAESAKETSEETSKVVETSYNNMADSAATGSAKVKESTSSMKDTVKKELEVLTADIKDLTNEQYENLYNTLMSKKEKYKEHKEAVEEIEKAITELAKEQYDTQVSYLNDAVDEMINTRKKLYGEQSDEIDEALQITLSSLDDELKAVEEAQKEKETREKEAKLKQKIADAETEDEKRKAQEEYNSWKEEQELKQYKQSIALKKQEAKEVASQLKSQKKNELDMELQAIEDFKALETEKAKIRIDNRNLSEEEVNKIAYKNIEDRSKAQIEAEKSIREEFESKYPEYKKLGVSTIDAFVDGFKSKSNLLYEEVRNIISSALSAASNLNIGSHRIGLEYVPVDGYAAQLHKGEMVLTQAEADRYRKQDQQMQQVNNIFDTSSLEGKIDRLTKTVNKIPSKMQINANMA